MKGIAVRAELAPRARELRQRGLLLREIAAQLDVATSTVGDWLADPDRNKAVARRRRYSVPCPVCGAAMDGSGGYKASPTACRACLDPQRDIPGGFRLCHGCGEVKTTNEFAKASGGRLARCHRCTAAKMREWQHAHPDLLRERARRYNRANPEKRRAHGLLNQAVADGAIQRLSACESCGERAPLLDGHHDDYSRPLDVRWLCRLCHRRHHAEFN